MPPAFSEAIPIPQSNFVLKIPSPSLKPGQLLLFLESTVDPTPERIPLSFIYPEALWENFWSSVYTILTWTK